MIEKGKSELKKWLEDQGNGLVVKNLDLTLQNNRVKVQGSVEHTPSDAEGHVSGYLQFKHAPGSPTMYLDGSNIDLDLDLKISVLNILHQPRGYER